MSDYFSLAAKYRQAVRGLGQKIRTYCLTSPLWWQREPTELRTARYTSRVRDRGPAPGSINRIGRMCFRELMCVADNVVK